MPAQVLRRHSVGFEFTARTLTSAIESHDVELIPEKPSALSVVD